ncbi:MAG TPA: dihydrofolate reductase family protein [Gemmatimonadaceae bacterium]|nr:dihydrofolate reductase family protein [Gemmatimonadaceae bacterium]
MRRLIMWNLQTLDGYFDGAKPWDLDWHMSAWGPELEALSLEQEKTVGTLIFGRATYQGMLGYWSKETGPTADFMNNVPKVVFSHTLTEATWNNTRLVRTDAADEIERLKREPGKDIFVFGSAALSDSLIRRGLFDEYRICLVPILLGSGVPLFKPSDHQNKLKLLDARTLATGGVILRYTPLDAEAAAA